MLNKIYIIDDDPMMAEVLAGYSTAIGMQGLTATSWRNVNVNELNRAACVLLDLSLPETDGIDIIDLMALEGVRCPIIICSGHDVSTLNTASELARAKGLAFGGCLQKPIGLAQFQSAVEQALQLEAESESPGSQRQPMTLSPADVQKAIADEAIYPVFQPQVSAATEKVVGIECLARLRHSSGVELLPESFLESVTEAHLTDQLTLLIVNQSFARLAPLVAGMDISISINLHPFSLSEDFFQRLDKTIEQYGMDKSQIVLEITESAALDSGNELKKVLTKMRLAGYGLSLDDFGTGYATVQELDTLPFNELKVDKRFVQSMLQRSTAEAIVDSTIGLARQLDYRVVAEGVETREQMLCLRQKGCDIHQGFWWSKPLTFKVLTDVIQQS